MLKRGRNKCVVTRWMSHTAPCLRTTGLGWDSSGIPGLVHLDSPPRVAKLRIVDGAY